LKPLAEDGAAMTREQAAGALEEILSGTVPDVETAALLTVMATRGEQAPSWLLCAGDARAGDAAAADAGGAEELVDVVGTGGGGPLTFNISSGAALVAAAAGAKVASTATARSLRAAAQPTCWKRWCTHRAGAGAGRRVPARDRLHVSLCAALSPAMKAIGPLRKALGFRTIFNLCDADQPGRRRIQVIGVLAPSRVLLVGRTLVALAPTAFVVHGTDGIDELTTTGESIVARVEDRRRANLS